MTTISDYINQEQSSLQDGYSAIWSSALQKYVPQTVVTPALMGSIKVPRNIQYVSSGIYQIQLSDNTIVCLGECTLQLPPNCPVNYSYTIINYSATIASVVTIDGLLINQTSTTYTMTLANNQVTALVLENNLGWTVAVSLLKTPLPLTTRLTTVSTTIVSTDEIVMNSGNSAITVSLPNPTGNRWVQPGYEIKIGSYGTSPNTTVAATNSLVDGASSVVLKQNFGFNSFVFFGISWISNINKGE